MYRVVLLALLAGAALAGETVTTTPNMIEAREADGTKVLVDGQPLRFVDPEACFAYWKGQLRERRVATLDFQCVPGPIKGKAAGTCDDVTQPEALDEFGFVVQPPLEHSLCPGSDTRYQFTQLQRVERPYPDCPVVQAMVVISCDPPAPIAYEYDDPADPPFEQMARYPVVEPGTPTDFEGVPPPDNSPDARP